MATGKTPKSGMGVEATVSKLRQTIQSLRTNHAIYENDMKREVDGLRTKYGLNSIEEGVSEIDKIDKLLAAKENELSAITNKISAAMEKYSGH